MPDLEQFDFGDSDHSYGPSDCIKGPDDPMNTDMVAEGIPLLVMLERWTCEFDTHIRHLIAKQMINDYGVLPVGRSTK